MMTARSVAASLSPRLRAGDPRVPFALLFAGLVAGAWGALWLLSASPYGRYVDHAGWSETGALAALCRAVPQGTWVVPGLLHAAVWLLMVAAMMLPTTWPLVKIFRRVTAARPGRGRLTALVVLGFFVAWFAFGIAAHGADALLLWAAGRSAWFIDHGWAVAAAVLAGAGLFQWSALKYRCLDECRTPFAFVGARWHGRSPSRDAFRIGLDHGLFCVGCCWALMLVMFVVGVGNLGWMLALAAVMAAEKNLSWGRHLRTPLGVGLLGWAGALVVAHI
jgi:predicted metal-binding membrane protein